MFLWLPFHCRYGASLTNGNMFSVFDLPVYGHRDTISGRTLRLEGLTQRNCWALQPMLRMEGVITAVAAFEGEIEGSIYFVSFHPRKSSSKAGRVGSFPFPLHCESF